MRKLDIKRFVSGMLWLPGAARLLSSLTSCDCTVFMLHRFRVPGLCPDGHDAGVLRLVLTELRKRGYAFISIDEVFRRLREDLPLRNTVAFTMDDGYFDQGRVAGPVFAELDCPATIFAVTGFLDGSEWLWWDKMQHIFEETKRTELRTRLGGQEFRFQLDALGGRSSWRPFAVRCQDATEGERLAAIRDLSIDAGVELPQAPPPRFAALSWDEARALEARGITFGPHTLTHPILTSTTDEQAEREIAGSWKRLASQVSRPSRVFCYPAGRAVDYGAREFAAVRRAGLVGAVSADPGNVGRAWLAQSPDNVYRVPRFSYQDSVTDVLQSVSGLEKLKSLARRGQPAPASSAPRP